MTEIKMVRVADSVTQLQTKSKKLKLTGVELSRFDAEEDGEGKIAAVTVFVSEKDPDDSVAGFRVLIHKDQLSNLWQGGGVTCERLRLENRRSSTVWYEIVVPAALKLTGRSAGIRFKLFDGTSFSASTSRLYQRAQVDPEEQENDIAEHTLNNTQDATETTKESSSFNSRKKDMSDYQSSKLRHVSFMTEMITGPPIVVSNQEYFESESSSSSVSTSDVGSEHHIICTKCGKKRVVPSERTREQLHHVVWTCDKKYVFLLYFLYFILIIHTCI